MKKAKMSSKKLRAILTPVMAVLLVLAVAATIGMNAFSSLMDDY